MKNEYVGSVDAAMYMTSVQGNANNTNSNEKNIFKSLRITVIFFK